jgi:2'-5' RNA ligase
MNFKDFANTIKIGVVGFSDDDCIPSEDVVVAYFHQALKDLGVQSSDEVIIVSGTTNMGVPKICYEEAKKLGYKTVGITAEEAKQYDLFKVDDSFFVGEKFGDESKFFLEYIDCMMKIGGGPQSIKEYKAFTKEKVEYSLDSGTFMGVKFSDDDADHIIDIAKKLGIPNVVKKKDLHVTVLFSRKELPNLEVNEKIDEWVYPKNFHVFPSFLDKEKKGALVIKLKSPFLEKRHKELLNLHDAMYDFPEYIPHVTLSYDCGDWELPKNIDMFRKEFHLEREYIEPLDLNWNSKS